MSLRDKLEAKKIEKTETEKERVAMSIQEKITAVEADIFALETRKQNIAKLFSTLKNNYNQSTASLDNFKSKKGLVKEIFTENEEVLKDDGIESFEQMLNENPDEEEVRAYRQAGVRGPKTIEDKEGDTGALYENINDLVSVKEALKAEMPELKLNFSARKVNNEDISHRDASFKKIEEYIKGLDDELIKLNKKKGEIVLDTPEGRAELILKDMETSRVLRDVSLDRPASFHLNNNQVELGLEIGEDNLKQIYKEELAKKLKNEIYGSMGWAIQANRAAAIKYEPFLNYPDLKKMMKLEITPEDQALIDLRQKNPYPDAETYIKKHGNLAAAWNEASRAIEDLRKIEKKIDILSKSAVDSNWILAYKANFELKNKEVLAKLAERQNLKEALMNSLPIAQRLLDSKFSDREVGLKSAVGDYSGKSHSIVDTSFDQYHKSNSSQSLENENNKQQFQQELFNKIDQDIKDLKNKIFAFGVNKKIDALNQKKQTIKEVMRLNDKINDTEAIRKILSQEEFEKIKSFVELSNQLRAEYRIKDQERIDFSKMCQGISINFKENDILNVESISIKDLASLLINRVTELNSMEKNADEEEKAIIKERDRIKQELERATKAFNEISREKIKPIL